MQKVPLKLSMQCLHWPFHDYAFVLLQWPLIAVFWLGEGAVTRVRVGVKEREIRSGLGWFV